MELISGVHVIDCGIVQAYLYQEADRLTLIDTGLSTQADLILDAVAAIGRKPADLRQIVLTHSHADHTGSLAELVARAGAEVIAHKLDAPVVRGDAPEPPPVLSDIERPFAEAALKATPPAPPCRVDREVVDGDEIDVGGGSVVVHVPGHTAGSIAIYVPKRKLLFSGDAAARLPGGDVIVGVFNVDTEQARQSFRRLASLDVETVCFGHGAPMDRDASVAFRRVADRLGG
jgi:glyoxylase-like metal-dependent hydrolase (beta-lactamase superfamily II)